MAFVFIGLFAIGQYYEVSVSGTVLDIETGAPLDGHMIYLNTDSISGDFFYYNNVVTNAEGYFEDSFEVPTGLSGSLFISTMGCQGNMFFEEVQFSENNNNFTFSFLSCADPGGGGNDCEAMFYYYPMDNSMYTIQFLDESYGYPNNWSWDFGDGISSTEQNPIHNYDEYGEYLVSLTISNDSLDCISTFEMPVLVGDTIWFPDSCVAMFYSYPEQEDFFTYNFIDVSIGQEGNAPDIWYWDFGDGTTSEEQNPMHVYTEEGMYEVCLTITTDDSLCESTFCEFIEVIDWDTYCQAQYYYYPANDSFPAGGDLGIQFFDMSYGNPTIWDWDFGDGSSSAEQNPFHIYEQDGFYEVCLTIENPTDSCLSTYCEEIYVFNDSTFDCWAWFEYEIDNLTVDFEAYLNNSQSGDYSWDFGDGTSGNGYSISHTYNTDGIYPVTLTVVDSITGCYSTYIDYLWVGDNITFNITGQVYLEDSVFVDDGVVYLMTFDTIGDGLINIADTEIEANGYYEFEEVGIENCMYFVQAELSDNSGYYGEYLPTYHVSALNWMESMPVFPFFFDYPADIFMIASDATNETGEGLITGTVTNEEGRNLMSNVEILLFDENNIPLTYIMTDDDGVFDFSHLPFGTYIVYAEIVGVETTPATITISADNPHASVNIVVKNGEAVLGIDKPQSAIIQEVGSIYPNPSSYEVSVPINMKKGETIRVTISNNFGQRLMNEVKDLGAGIQNIDLDISQLPKGIYFINVKAYDGIVHIQKLVKL